MSKINLWINGTKKDFNSFKTTNLEELILALNLDPKFLAIALNNEVILKSDYQSTQLKENDWIEIISPQSGDNNQTTKDQLILGEEVFHSRLLLGSSNYPDLQTLKECVLNSQAQIVTVGIRRINIENSSQSTGLISLLKELKVKLLPNTAGCFTAYEAILTAKLAKEALGTDWVKLEVIGDKYSLYPDSEELLIAARELVKANFKVLPYCLDDPIVCQKLRDLGCVAVMPLASPIGSGQGIRNPYNIELIRKKIDIPVIIDAGIGSPKDAAFAMELGADGVLMNTAIAEAKDPSQMAYAMNLAIQAGRLAYQAGRIPEKKWPVHPLILKEK